MLNRLKVMAPLLGAAAASALGLGVVAALVHEGSPPSNSAVIAPANGLQDTAGGEDPVLSLALAAPEVRATQLQALSEATEATTRHRARYLLALDHIQQGRGGSAIPLLTGLAEDYPLMAPYVLLALAQAQTAAGQPDAAAATRATLLEKHGNDPATAEWLYQAGQDDPSQLDQLLAQFPDHPRSVEVAHQRLSADPNRADALPLLLTIARSGLHHPAAGAALTRLSSEFADQLSPDHWQIVGFGYWRLDDYAQAGLAYARAPESPRNLYRAARGQQIGGRRAQAIQLFSRLDQQYPTAPETATGLLRLSLSLPTAQAIGVLEQVEARFPDRAAEAVARQVEVYAQSGDAAAAQAQRQRLIDNYPTADATADLRLDNALAAANRGDTANALFWGQSVLEQSPDSEAAAEAGFWVGQWARAVGQAAVAQQALEQVIAYHPESYYAWRAAVALGWDVGDFQTVRFEAPVVERPSQRTPLPTGSDRLQELYLLGQDTAAWQRWQTEFANRQDPSVAEQFTDGLMRLGQSDNLLGIYMVSSLAWRDDPQDQAAYRQLSQTPDYWSAVYPFPFAEPIERWSAQRDLNPLLVTALIRQESRFEPAIRSHVGATGLMQVMPATAQWIEGQAGYPATDLEQPDPNIKLGTWYLAYTHREYDNHSLYAVASYNAGPGNVAKWKREGGFASEDEFVEKIPFPETKGYVEAVFGGYWNYLRLYNPDVAQAVADHQQRLLNGGLTP